MGVRIYQALNPNPETGDPRGRALWPEERPLSWLRMMEASMPTVMFNSQYQNDPSGLRGVRYDPTKLHYYLMSQHIPPFSKLRCVQCCDIATSTEASADYFGHCTAARDVETGRVFILDIQYAQIAPDEHLAFIKGHYLSWKQRGLTPQVVQLEARGPQKGTTTNLMTLMRMSRDAIPLEEIFPVGSKEDRFDAALPYMTNGTVLLKGKQTPTTVDMSDDSGFQEFLREFSRFPQGRDDVFDAVVMTIEELCSSVTAAGGYESLTDSLQGFDENPDDPDVELNYNQRLREQRTRDYDQRGNDSPSSSGQHDPRRSILERAGRRSLVR